MREELNIYINGKPYVLREDERPFKNMQARLHFCFQTCQLKPYIRGCDVKTQCKNAHLQPLPASAPRVLFVCFDHLPSSSESSQLPVAWSHVTLLMRRALHTDALFHIMVRNTAASRWAGWSTWSRRL